MVSLAAQRARKAWFCFVIRRSFDNLDAVSELFPGADGLLGGIGAGNSVGQGAVYVAGQGVDSALMELSPDGRTLTIRGYLGSRSSGRAKTGTAFLMSRSDLAASGPARRNSRGTESEVGLLCTCTDGAGGNLAQAPWRLPQVWRSEADGARARGAEVVMRLWR